MTGYTIYLTKSREVAELIAKGLSITESASMAHISHGNVHQDKRIPAIYHNDGWYYASMEYDDLDFAEYEIIFA